ncbi:MAG: DUF4129 domain-containing protein, partial [Planctomycetes bacterium]|nr:DUF4129 domain-containing protein [Planctomycetota bacterium]
NRRSDLEGWDVELVFRRLAQRARQGVRLSGFVPFALPWVMGLGASGSSQEAGQRPVDIVFASDEFRTTVQREIFTGGSHGLPGGIRALFETAVWLGLAFLVGYLIYRCVVWAMGVENKGAILEVPEDSGPLELAGLDLRRESLPTDVAGEARSLWAAGQARAALSLLYRGALVSLRDEHGLVIEDGDTEGRCVRKVFALEALELGSYFGGLTDLWTRLAYGGRHLDSDEFSGLVQGFAEHFGGAR